MNHNENTEQAVPRVNELIAKLETHLAIKGVFMDSFDSSNELMEMLNLPLSEIDYIYMKEIEDEFDNELINHLSRTEHFEIKLID